MNDATIEPQLHARLLEPPGWAVPLIWMLGGLPYEVLAFAIGSIPFGVLVGRIVYKTDIRASGSGNIGAANAMRTFGTKGGIAVLLLDAFKGVASVLAARYAILHVPLYVVSLGRWIAPQATPIWPLLPLAGFAAVLGHCYSPWLRWRGGKGVATFLGATSALSWESGVAFGIVWFAVVLPTGYASVGSMLGTVAAGVALVVTGGTYGASGMLFAAAAAILVIVKHRENIARLDAGTENRLSLLRR